ncbi:hypothetical protein KC332_g15937 [Hortaea werneckii]|nr:hypothetical protein KC358_g16148 [Hortaea werneckii]KAI6846979.1 hypothetical protein KC350_g3677 [Hortaea werneckii]KAI6938995.1 hypothetical protein KC341_g4491 [Hortaea werneckii]KAI6941833.1 hypothetical protein KC348_g4610 [Hortaea werneckii]KAI6975267.1 hypothetical protein KC321_g4645 [Hortaea werneckii]
MDNLTPPPSQEMAFSGAAFGSPPTIELDAQQQEAYDDAVAGRNLFITGAAGSGKATIIRMLISALQDRGKRVRICAPTGKAAEQIGGTTYHSFLKLNQGTNNNSIRQLEWKARASWLRPQLKDTDVLFIDEISMVQNEDLQRIDRMLRAARSSNEPFGGVQVIFCGDFLQLPPVEPFKHCLQCGRQREPMDSHHAYKCRLHGTVELTEKWAFQAPVWEEANMKHIFLFKVHRQNNDDFRDILFRLWLGKQLTSGEIRLLTDHNFTGIAPVKLYSTRREVTEENLKEIRKLPGRKVTYTALDEFLHNPDHLYLSRKGVTERNGKHLLALQNHKYDSYVELKLGMRVMLLTNLDVERGLVNGSVGTVVDFKLHDEAELLRPSQSHDDHYHEADDRNERLVADSTLMFGTSPIQFRREQIKGFIDESSEAKWPIVKFDNGLTRCIHAICDIQKLGDDEPYSLLTRTQLPLQAAYALTIHKSQGMTLGSVLVDVSRCFEPGQVYVALSRASTLEGLKVVGLTNGYAFPSGNAEVHEFLWEKFPELRAELDDGQKAFGAE